MVCLQLLMMQAVLHNCLCAKENNLSSTRSLFASKEPLNPLSIFDTAYNNSMKILKVSPLR